MTEPKKTTAAKTQLGWQLDKTEIVQTPWGAEPYAHLLEPARGSSPAQTNANVQQRRPNGSTPPPSAPLFNDPTKPAQYNMAAYARELDPATTAAYRTPYGGADYTASYGQPAPAQPAPQDYSSYAAQLQAYAAQQEAAAQQQAYAEQYAQQQAYYQQQQQQAYAQHAQQQQAYAQQYVQQGYAAPYAQPQAYDAAQVQQAQQAQYAAQYQQQVAAYEQQQREQQQAKPQEATSLGGMAAKLQKKAEKARAKLAAAQASSEASGREDKIAGAVATAGQHVRRDFVRRTYRTLLVAILAFTGLLWAFRTIDPLVELFQPFVNFSLSGRWNWGVVLAAFMGASILAERWSHAKSRKVQYLGLAFYVLAEAVIFVPLMAVVEWKTASIVAGGGGEPHIVRDAAFMTLAVFGMLTASVVFSKKDFSFLRSALFMASGVALTLIVLSLMFGFGLGLIFSAAMVLLAGGYILYHTSQVLQHHDPEGHVAAALDLFSSVALMFWYMIRIFMRARD